jgi:hypothetical protein
METLETVRGSDQDNGHCMPAGQDTIAYSPRPLSHALNSPLRHASPAHMFMLYSVTYACGNAVMRVNRADNAASDVLCRLSAPYAKDLSLCVRSVSHY